MTMKEEFARALIILAALADDGIGELEGVESPEHYLNELKRKYDPDGFRDASYIYTIDRWSKNIIEDME